MPFPTYTPTLANFAHHLAESYGDHELIVLDRQRLSFAEAEARSATLARGLLADGVGKGTRVGLLMPNGPDWLVAMLAVTRIGALLVPINTFSKGRELAWILKHADVDTLLTVSRFLSHDYPEILETAVPELAQPTERRLRTEARFGFSRFRSCAPSTCGATARSPGLGTTRSCCRTASRRRCSMRSRPV